MKTLTLLLVTVVLLNYVFCIKDNKDIRSKKKGIVVPYWPIHRCGDFDSFETVGWWYNYLTQKDPRQFEYEWWCKCPDGDVSTCLPEKDNGMHFIPMEQGVAGHGNHPDWDEPVAADWYPFLLGYNEPNQAEQANLTPQEAATAWLELQATYPNKSLVAPAMAGAHTDWFDEFYAICEEVGCRFEYLAVHMYDGKADHIMDTLEQFSKRYGNKKIWFTEFAVYKNHNEDEIVAFIEEILPRLEAANFVFRYAWFLTRYYPDPDMTGSFWIDPINSLVELNSSSLTAVGRAYDFPYHLYI